MRLAQDRRRRSETPDELICQACWVVVPFARDNVIVTPKRITYHCPHCDAAFPIRYRDFTEMALSSKPDED